MTRKPIDDDKFWWKHGEHDDKDNMNDGVNNMNDDKNRIDDDKDNLYIEDRRHD